MRKYCLLVIIFMVYTGMMLCGCGGGARDVPTPSQALIGSWKPANPGGAFIYFSPDTATYVPAKGGKSIAVHYEIVEENTGEFWVKLRYGDSGAGEEPFLIKFSGDRNRFYLYPSSAPEVLEYTYVNDRETP